MYNWESGGNHIRRKKINKTGTVVFHKDPSVDTNFARLAKEYPLHRVQRNNTNRLQQDASAADEEDNAMQFVTDKDEGRATAPFMTEDTIGILSSAKGPFKFDGLLPSQAQCYKGIFKGRDVILHSRTGSGKTLAYALPLIERFLILDQTALNGREEDKSSKKKKSAQMLPAPFLLIFVFSNELAFQTKSVLDNIYAKRGLKIAVAGMDTLSSFDAIDVLIGTVPAMDVAIRGKDAPLNPIRRKYGSAGAKRQRDPKDEAAAPSKKDDAKKDRSNGNALDEMAAISDEDDSELDDELNAETSSDEDDEEGEAKGFAPAATAQVSASRVRCVVVDEVDTTLGPRFSVIGKRMKMLLHTVRRSNGSLQPTRLMRDFRAHHYVLCGATIPNWVIKAGFLGLKKYYFQLVEAGQTKLPSTLEAYLMLNDGTLNPAKYSSCNGANPPAITGLDIPMQMMCEAIGMKTDGWGRIVVFGTTKQIDRLEGAMNAILGVQRAATGTTAVASPKGKPAGKKGTAAAAASSSAALTSSSDAPAPTLAGWSHITAVRSISSSKDEVERIKNIADFNNGVANVLLCTDIASRGLDFVGVDVVFMLHLPNHRVMAAETFVHRAGRTARVNNQGKCIAFAENNKDEHIITAIETATHVTFRKLSLAMLPVNEATGMSAFNATSVSASSSTPVAPTVSAAAEEKTVKRSLVVKSPFMSSAPANAGNTEGTNTPAQVLIRELKGKHDKDVRNGELDLFEALVKKMHVVDANTVTFETPLVYDHVLTGKLWKYNLKIVK